MVDQKVNEICRRFVATYENEEGFLNAGTCAALRPVDTQFILAAIESDDCPFMKKLKEMDYRFEGVLIETRTADKLEISMKKLREAQRKLENEMVVEGLRRVGLIA